MKEKLPDGWEWKKLGDITEIKKGNSITKSIIEEGNIPVIAGGREPAYYHNKSNRDGETITVSASGAYAGYVNYFCTPIFASDCSTIKIINSDALLTKFIYWRLKAYQEQIYAFQKGGGQPHVYPKDLMDIPIQLPPLDVQQKIVSILEKAEETKRLRAQADELTQEFLKSVFLEMFGDPERNEKGWEIKPFKHFAEIDTVMTKDFNTFQDYPHIGIENIEKETGRLIDYKLVKEQNLISGKYVFSKEHIIYSKIRPNLNKVALPTFDGLCSADAYPLLVNEGSSNKYFLAHILRTDFFLNYILKHSDRTNIPKVNKNQLNSFHCICPSLSLQQKFGAIVEHAEKIREQQTQSSQEINTLFDSLMQKAFTGELVC